MILDHRTYTCHPGRIKKHMKLYEDHGWEAQRLSTWASLSFTARSRPATSIPTFISGSMKMLPTGQPSAPG